MNIPRVLMVTPRYRPYSGGTETHVAEVSRRLAALRPGAVTIVTADPSGALPMLAAEEHGTIVRRVRAYPSGGPLGELLYAPTLGATIAAARADHDLLHLQGAFTLFAPTALRAARRAGLPYVVTLHSGGHSSGLRNLLRGAQFAALRPLLAGARRLIAVSRFEAAFYGAKLRLPADRFAVIPNGVNLGVAPDEVVADGGDGTLIVSTGRLERFKGHQHAIAAMPHLKQSRPDVRLRIVGSGPYEQELRRLAANLGVADRVEIAAIPPDDRGGMARLLRRADLVVAFSAYESQGIGIGEALALGCRVLVTDATAFAELVEAKLARGVAPGSSAQTVALAMQSALAAPPIATTATLPTWDTCTAQLAALYEQTAISYQLSAISYQPSAISHQPPPTS